MISLEHVAQVDAYIHQIVPNRSRYEAVAASVGMPWYVVAAIHLLEGGLRFTTHLHNGDPLSARTTHVPAGRPIHGNPPFTWEESTIDALSRFATAHDWTVAGTLWHLEGYNGWGYRSHGIPTPYLWSFTNHYTRGKYVADGQFDPNAVSRQCGAAALLRRMQDTGVISPLVP